MSKILTVKSLIIRSWINKSSYFGKISSIMRELYMLSRLKIKGLIYKHSLKEIIENNPKEKENLSFEGEVLCSKTSLCKHWEAIGAVKTSKNTENRLSIYIPTQDIAISKSILLEIKKIQNLPSQVSIEILLQSYEDESQIEKETSSMHYLAQGLGWQIKIKKSPHNVSFSRFVNEAIKSSDGIALFLNDTIRIMNLDYSRIENAFGSSENVGLIGAIHKSESMEFSHVCFNHNGGNSHHKPARVALDIEFDLYKHEYISVPSVGFGLIFINTKVCTSFLLDEKYWYGLEDIDFCLQLISKSISILIDTSAKYEHLEMTSRALDLAWPSIYERNHRIFRKKWHHRIDNIISQISNMSYKEKIAILVSSFPTENEIRGDFLSAKNLVGKLFPDSDVNFFEKKDNAISGFDRIITFNYNDSLKDWILANPCAVNNVWLRNRLDDWIPVIESNFFGKVATEAGSSNHLIDYIYDCERLSFFDLIEPNSVLENKSLDILLVGNNFENTRQEVAYTLNQLANNFSIEVYGAGWDNSNLDSKIYKGVVQPEAIGDLYSKSRITIDFNLINLVGRYDFSNKRIAESVSNRCMILSNISNNEHLKLGEKFGQYYYQVDFSDYANFERNVRLALENWKRIEWEALFRFIFQPKNTVFFDDEVRMKITIHTSAPKVVEREWGDIWFARGLVKEFRDLGFTCRILRREASLDATNSDEINLWLLGIDEPYLKNKTGINIAWIISHPKKWLNYDFNDFDAIYVASIEAADRLNTIYPEKVSYMPQGHSDLLMAERPSEEIEKFEVLYVGNARGQLKREGLDQAIDHAISHDLQLTVVSDNLQIPNDKISRMKKTPIILEHIEYTKLGHYYKQAGVVFMDAWPDMSSLGFIPNKFFDIIASGGVPIFIGLKGATELDKIISNCRAGILDSENRELIINRYSLKLICKEIASNLNKIP